MASSVSSLIILAERDAHSIELGDGRGGGSDRNADRERGGLKTGQG